MQTAALGLSASLYVLNSCPIHSRYQRHGIGKREVFQVGQFLVNNTEQVRTFTVLDPCLQNTTFVLDESSAFPLGIFHHQFFSQMISFFTVFVILILIKMSTSNNSFAWKFLLWCNYFGEGDFSHGKEVWKVRKNSFTVPMNWPMILYHFRKKHATRFLTGLKTSEDSFSRTKFALMFYEFHADNYRCMFFFFETKLILFCFFFLEGRGGLIIWWFQATNKNKRIIGKHFLIEVLRFENFVHFELSGKYLSMRKWK